MTDLTPLVTLLVEQHNAFMGLVSVLGGLVAGVVFAVSWKA